MAGGELRKGLQEFFYVIANRSFGDIVLGGQLLFLLGKGLPGDRFFRVGFDGAENSLAHVIRLLSKGKIQW